MHSIPTLCSKRRRSNGTSCRKGKLGGISVEKVFPLSQALSGDRGPAR